MRRCFNLIVKVGVLFSFFFLIYFAFINYFQLKQIYYPNSLEVTLSRGFILILLNFLLLILVFIINISIYRKIFLFLVIFGIIAWNLLHLQNTLGFNLVPGNLLNFQEAIFYLSVAIVAPGIILFIVHYIKKISVKFEGNFIGKYHLHESFLGIILFGLGIPFYIIRFNMIQLEIFWKEYKLYLAIIMIFLYFFLFFGSFFVFRDFHDLVRLKFLEKVEKPTKKHNSNDSAFNSITMDDLHFFKLRKLYILPFGLLLTSISFLMVIYGNDFLPKEFLTHEFIVNFGYLLCIFAGGLIGVDWLRIFKRFYPSHYHELEQKIDELTN